MSSSLGRVTRSQSQRCREATPCPPRGGAGGAPRFGLSPSTILDPPRGLHGIRNDHIPAIPSAAHGFFTVTFNTIFYNFQQSVTSRGVYLFIYLTKPVSHPSSKGDGNGDAGGPPSARAASNAARFLFTPRKQENGAKLRFKATMPSSDKTCLFLYSQRD